MKTFSKIVPALLVGALAFTAFTAGAQLPSREKSGPRVLTEAEVKERALAVDKFIAEKLREQGMGIAGDSTDEQFLRRAYLNIIGRIPNYQEAIAFLDNEDPNKRAELIDSLIGSGEEVLSPGYDSHMFNFWADILRAVHRPGANNRTNAISYLNYVKNSIASNKPYDQWVREMITASGGGWQRSSGGAVGYLERDKGMPLDNMANTMQIFTGTRMECAQCHNHPHNEAIEQVDFFYMAGFTHGLKSPREQSYGDMQERKMYDTAKPEVRNFVRQLRYDVFDFGVKGKGEGRIPLPMDYQYRDKDPGEVVGARTIFGKSVRNASGKDDFDGREKFSNWLTTSENPRFTKVIANRLWKKVMGQGLFEPVDELDMEVTISHPGLLTYLEKMMVDLGYDMKQYMRVLYNTRTFQFRPNPDEVDSGRPYHFAGRVLSRMSSEQIWDSMLATTVPAIDERKGTHYLPYLQYRGRYVMVGKKTMYDLYEETMNLHGKELYDYVEKLLKELDSDGGASGKEMMEMAMMGGGASGGGVEMDPRWNSFSEELIRASELSSPAPANHFLRKFGQSSREVIEGATSESDVTQILSLINGHVEDHIVGNRSAMIYEEMEKASTTDEKIEVAFLSTLTRRPTPDELALFKQNIEAVGDKGYDDLVWTLFNTNEFMFVQ